MKRPLIAFLTSIACSFTLTGAVLLLQNDRAVADGEKAVPADPALARLKTATAEIAVLPKSDATSLEPAEVRVINLSEGSQEVAWQIRVMSMPKPSPMSRTWSMPTILEVVKGTSPLPSHEAQTIAVHLTKAPPAGSTLSYVVQSGDQSSSNLVQSVDQLSASMPGPIAPKVGE